MSKRMYPHVTTVNPASGSCEYGCCYCYMNELKRNFPDVRKKYSGVSRMDDKALKRICGSGKVYFVGSGVDLFGYQHGLMPAIFERCYAYDNYYLFQTKQPYRYCQLTECFPNKSILATTIETNRDTSLISVAPAPDVRFAALRETKKWLRHDADMPNEAPTKWSIMPRIAIIVEPILEFDFEEFYEQLVKIHPDIVVIGADSGNNNLPEPNFEKVCELIDALTAALLCVRLKDTLFDRYPELPYERWTDDIWRIDNE